MTSKRIKVDVSQFIDIEAVDQGSDVSTDYDDDNESIEETEDQTTAGSTSLPLFRWDDVDQDEDEDEAIQLSRLASEIQNRYRRSTSFQHEATPFPEHPTLEDAHIWRVRVKKGSEKNVVLAVFQMAHLRDFGTNILCAFMRDEISGSVYVEAPTIIDVRRALAGIPGVFRTRDQHPRVECVSIEDRVPLLEMSSTTNINRGSWVRIKKHGLYQNDLAFVLDFDIHLMETHVALIPRIRLTRKRQQRPNASLFDLEAVKSFYGHSSVVQHNEIFVFKNGEYKNGLFEQSLTYIDILDHNVSPTPSELQLFSQCGDPHIVNAAYQEMVHLRKDDRIEVIAGELRGLWGRFIDIDQHGAAIVSPSFAVVPPQGVREYEIRKGFLPGDLVQVISGEQQGAEGYIVGIDKKYATLYCCPPGQPYSTGQGKELYLDLVHIDFKSSHIGESGAALQSKRHHSSVSTDQDTRLMYTGQDPYKNMEVMINVGHYKSHFGIVQTTQEKDDKTLIVIRTTTKVENVDITLEMKDVTHLHTGLALPKARWLPKGSQAVLPPQYQSKTPPLMTPLTPDQSTAIEEMETPLERAWDPKFHLEGSPEHVHVPQPGEWLLNPCLVNKRLDVRIKGTAATLWQNGRYENQIGFTILTKALKNVSDSVAVKMGYTQSRIFFRAYHLSPEITTEQLGPAPHPTYPALPLISTIGARVVIIGADLLGDLSYVGLYALIVYCPYTLEPGQACVQVISGQDHAGYIGYFAETSLCRSLVS